MKIAKVLACSLLVAAATLSTASADKYEGQPVTPGRNTGQDPGTYSDGSTYHIFGTGDGPTVQLSNPPQGWIYRYFNVMQARRSPTEVPDSSAVYPSAGATRWFAFARTTLDGDSSAAVLFGIQVRGHPVNNNDSLTTNVWMPTCSQDPDDAAFGTPDTIGTLRSMNFGLWDADDCMPNERPWVVVHHGYPRGQMIPLTVSRCAEEFSSDYISVRLRALRVYKADGTVHSVPVQTSYVWDLYGYR